MNDDLPLNDRERQLMAYVDDEMSPAERAAFELAMREDRELALEAVRLENLMDLSRSVALPEPTDAEVRRFWARFYNRTEWQVGWALFLVGVTVLAGNGLYLLVTSTSLTWTQKAAVISTLLGGALLLWNVLRLKVRTSRFDRYRGVMR